MKKTCSFFGNNNVTVSDKILKNLELAITEMIKRECVTEFIFKDGNKFNKTCLQIVSKLKAKQPIIKRVLFVENLESSSKDFEDFEQIELYPPCLASRPEKNRFLIDKSDFIIFCFNEKQNKIFRAPAIYAYAKQKNKEIRNISKLK